MVYLCTLVYLLREFFCCIINTFTKVQIIEKSWPIHYKKGPSNFIDMGPWAHTLLFLGNTLCIILVMRLKWCSIVYNAWRGSLSNFLFVIIVPNDAVTITIECRSFPPATPWEKARRLSREESYRSCGRIRSVVSPRWSPRVTSRPSRFAVRRGCVSRNDSRFCSLVWYQVPPAWGAARNPRRPHRLALAKPRRHRRRDQRLAKVSSLCTSC